MTSALTSLGLSITCHAWNADCSMIALAPNNALVDIYATNGSVDDSSKWVKKYTLSEHSQFVSSIDWSPVNNSIVTAGHDRNAYVWKLNKEKDTWEPTLVILRIPRAATFCRWSPSGQKFAVGSGAKCVPVCHYEEKNNWWISNMIKNHKSTILSLAWCPNSKFIVTGASDFKCRIFSAFIKKLDNPEDDGYADVFPGQKLDEFGTVLGEFDQCRAWVNSVAWSPGGYRIAFTGHDSRVNFIQLLAGSAPAVQSVVTKNLPFLDIAFLSDSSVVTVGYDYNPLCLTADGDEANPVWSVKVQLDKETKEEKKSDKGAVSDIRDKWKQADSKNLGMKQRVSASTDILTRHQNTITGLCLIGAPTDAIKTHFTTCALDGQILDWDLKASGFDLKDLKLA